jgi:hypothetical protein
MIMVTGTFSWRLNSAGSRRGPEKGYCAYDRGPSPSTKDEGLMYHSVTVDFIRSLYHEVTSSCNYKTTMSALCRACRCLLFSSAVFALGWRCVSVGVGTVQINTRHQSYVFYQCHAKRFR